MNEITPNGIEFDWWLASSAGAGFCVMPVKDYHTKSDVDEAKRHLRLQRDVVTLRVEWWEPSKMETKEYLDALTALAAGPPKELLDLL